LSDSFTVCKNGLVCLDGSDGIVVIAGGITGFSTIDFDPIRTVPSLAMYNFLFSSSFCFASMSFNSFSVGNVANVSGSGGLVGMHSGGGSVTNSFWDNQTSGQSTFEHEQQNSMFI
jgi:hypothetical protein